MRHLVLPLAGRLTPFDSWRMMRELSELDFAPLERQQTLQLERLQALIAHAYEQVTHYREAFDEAGLRPGDIDSLAAATRIPITTKDHLRRRFPDRQLARSHRGAWLRYSNTSGTSGRPLMLIQDLGDISAKYAAILRSRDLGGVDPFGSQLRITPNECQPALPDGSSPSGRLLVGLAAGRSRSLVLLERELLHPILHRRLVLPAFWHEPSCTAHVDYDRYLDRIEAYAPAILQLHPLYALAFAKHILRTGRRPPTLPGVIDTSGALMPPAVRRLVKEAFGIRVTQACGGCEFARYGACCPDDPDRMHLAEGFAHVEAVRPDDSPCAPGELGNVLVSGLHGRAMPILRIEPGDVGRLIQEPCSCGRHSRRIQHEGRIQSVLRTPTGGWTTARDCWDALLPLPGLLLFQLRQHSPERYELTLVREPGMELPQAEIDDALQRLLGPGATVEQREAGRLRPEASGKLRLVVSSTYGDFRPASVRDLHVPIN